MFPQLPVRSHGGILVQVCVLPQGMNIYSISHDTGHMFFERYFGLDNYNFLQLVFQYKL